MEPFKAVLNNDYLRIAEAALLRCRRGEVRESLLTLQQAMHSARLSGDRAGEVAVRNALALANSVRGDYWSSLAGGLDTFRLAQELDDGHGMAAAATTVAGAMILLAPAERELWMLEHAVTLAQEFNDVRLQVRIRNLLGIMMGDSLRFDEAEGQFDMALALAGCDPSGLDGPRVHANVANLLRKRAQAARAAGNVAACESLVRAGLVMVARLRQESTDHANTPLLIDCLGIAGMLHNTVGRPADALQAFNEAWRLGLSSRLRTGLPFLGLEIARLDMDCGRLDSAERTLTQAVQEASFYRPSPKMVGLANMLAGLHKARGDVRGELHWRRHSAEAATAFDDLVAEVRRHVDLVMQAWRRGHLQVA